MPDPQAGEVRVATASPDKTQEQRTATEKFLRLARDRWKSAEEAEQKSRTDGLDDLRFRAGQQWPDDLETQRGLDGRPCLTINRLPPIIRQVTNEQRQQRPSIVVNPIGDGADVDTAEMIQGMIRHIEVNSDAEIAYDTAFESGVTIGFGYWKIETDYVPKTFDQEIYIRRVKNPFRIYFDPAAIEPCYEDAMWAFEIEDLPIAEYKLQYPNSEAAALVDFESIGDQAPDWATKDTIRVAMYHHIEQTQRELVKLESGDVKFAEEVKPEDGKPIARRKVLDRKVIKTKINAVEILEETTWPSNWIGLVPMLADDLEIDGERYLAGIVRDAKDPQRMYNYWNSSATETIALAPRAPFVGAVGQFEGQEGKWQMANTRNLTYLEYNPVGTTGKAEPPPQRQQYEPPIQAMNVMLMNASNDLKSVTGIFDPSLGENKRDQSGKAVQLLQKQSDVSNMHFVDNLSRAMRHTGRILIDLIPKIYDAPRIQRIINPDQSVKHVVVHANQGDAAKGVQTSDPLMKIYDLGVGRYDVTVSVGPSYQSKRQESVASIMALVSAYPQIMQTSGDILVGNMDWPGAKEISARLKKALPPQFQDEDDQSPEAQLARTQAQLHQAMQQHDMLVKVVGELTDKIKTDQVKQEANIKIADLNNATKIAVAEISTKAQIAIERAKTVQGVWSEMTGHAHEAGLQAADQAHDRGMATSQQGHEQDLQAQGADQQAQLAQQAAEQPQNGAGA